MKTASLVFLAFLLGQSEGLVWFSAFNGFIPPKAVGVRTKSGGLTVFCRISDAKTGQSLVGSISTGEKECRVINNEKNVQKSTEYQVLCLRLNEEPVEWVYPKRHDEIPAKAVSCGPDCYFGQSLYSDGICDEKIGRVISKDNMIYMEKNEAMSRCPFFLIMTAKDNKIESLEAVKLARVRHRKRWLRNESKNSKRSSKYAPTTNRIY